MFKKILQKLFPSLFKRGEYLAYGVEESISRYPLDKARYPRIASFIQEEAQRLNRPLRILDIGCNRGMMLRYCKARHIEAEFYGMDVISEFLTVAKSQGYHSVITQDIRRIPYPFEEGFFDVVILSHILEHLEAPGEALKEVRRIIKTGGVAIVGVPVGLLPFILWRRYVTPLCNPYKRKEASLARFGHVTFFTLPALKGLLKQCGFVAETARGDFLIRARGFILENYKWWFDLNQLFGKLFPGVLGHVTLKTRASTDGRDTAF